MFAATLGLLPRSTATVATPQGMVTQVIPLPFWVGALAIGGLAMFFVAGAIATTAYCGARGAAGAQRLLASRGRLPETSALLPRTRSGKQATASRRWGEAGSTAGARLTPDQSRELEEAEANEREQAQHTHGERRYARHDGEKGWRRQPKHYAANQDHQQNGQTDAGHGAGTLLPSTQTPATAGLSVRSRQGGASAELGGDHALRALRREIQRRDARL